MQTRVRHLIKNVHFLLSNRVFGESDNNYSEIPLLRPPKIKICYLLTTLFWKFKLSFKDHFWTVSKVVLIYEFYCIWNQMPPQMNLNRPKIWGKRGRCALMG